VYSLGENEVNPELLGDEGNDWKLLTGCVDNNLGINGDRSRDSVHHRQCISSRVDDTEFEFKDLYVRKIDP
jgi:hypothetical protein